MRRRGRAIAAATIGTALEAADITIYGFLAGVLAKVFFPTSDPTVSLLIAFASYGTTFLLRPLGAVFFGTYADTVGRKSALALALILMGVGSLAIGLMPSYAAIGIWAPIGVLIARLVQGFSVGGEQGSAVAFVAEQGTARRSENLGWLAGSGGPGQILAAGMGAGLAYFLTPAQVEEWGWRIPFIIGALICPIGVYIRRATSETEAFVKAEKQSRPALTVFATYWKQLLVAMCANAVMTVTLYLGMYLPGYSTTHLGLSAAPSLVTTMISGLVIIVACPLFGRLSDRIGRMPVILPAAIALVILPWPLLTWLASDPSFTRLLLIQVCLAGLFSAYTPAQMSSIAQIFPTNVRASGVSIAGAAAVGLMGGFSFFAFELLAAVVDHAAAPALYLTVVALASLFSVFMISRWSHEASWALRGDATQPPTKSVALNE